MEPNKPLLPSSKREAAVDRSGIKADYKKWKESLSHQDFAKWLESCYNEYTDYGNDLSLPRDVRNSYLDRACALKLAIDYIKRQA